MEWQKCPICSGCGLVGGGFYDSPGQVDGLGNRLWVSDDVAVTCRTCAGKSIISTPESTKTGDNQ